jgi:hypothetical protein
MGHLRHNPYLEEGIDPFNNPIGDRICVMGRLAIDEKECDRTDNGESTPRGKHRKGAKASPQVDDTEKGGIQEWPSRPECGVQ